MSERVLRCPVCGGCGAVRIDFYGGFQWTGGTSTLVPQTECRTCVGLGIIRVRGTTLLPMKRPRPPTRKRRTRAQSVAENRQAILDYERLAGK
jgi:hypothetical protein